MPQRRDRVAADPDLGSASRDGHERLTTALAVPLVIAAGGALGAVARFGLAVWVPQEQGSFPWATFWTNTTGCLLIGMLMVALTEVAGRPHRLLRPFIGVGILGGFTTFSTYTVEVHQLLTAVAPGVGLAYLFGTLAAALTAVEVGMVIIRWATRDRVIPEDSRR